MPSLSIDTLKAVCLHERLQPRDNLDVSETDKWRDRECLKACYELVINPRPLWGGRTQDGESVNVIGVPGGGYVLVRWDLHAPLMGHVTGKVLGSDASDPPTVVSAEAEFGGIGTVREIKAALSAVTVAVSGHAEVAPNAAAAVDASSELATASAPSRAEIGRSFILARLAVLQELAWLPKEISCPFGDAAYQNYSIGDGPDSASLDQRGRYHAAGSFIGELIRAFGDTTTWIATEAQIYGLHPKLLEVWVTAVALAPYLPEARVQRELDLAYVFQASISMSGYSQERFVREVIQPARALLEPVWNRVPEPLVARTGDQFDNLLTRGCLRIMTSLADAYP